MYFCCVCDGVCFGCFGVVSGALVCLMVLCGVCQACLYKIIFYTAVFVKIKSRRKPQGVQYIKGA